jgi:hypothetical protein
MNIVIFARCRLEGQTTVDKIGYIQMHGNLRIWSVRSRTSPWYPCVPPSSLCGPLTTIDNDGMG